VKDRGAVHPGPAAAGPGSLADLPGEAAAAVQPSPAGEELEIKTRT